ncbi:LAME_0B02388g1_1 [Lachancea meyersii CBS 8951]|uniref:LAME_0B02388g1_1 n=1 Tax=Lachancea meyersii CBS 8951 TaxID=1266667 RepID=A0A1G4ITQ3_9SACH|nr:LAME_0B02388g1_1 [Lachancea meyersii CBS 8951]
MTQTAVARLQQQQQQQQQQHEETVTRDARIRLNLKKTFMDDEFFFPEVKLLAGPNLNTASGREFASPVNLRAVLKSNLSMVPKSDAGKTSLDGTRRFTGQQYYQNQLLAAVQQQQQQHQKQQRHHQHQQHQHHNPYLNNSGFQVYSPQQDVNAIKGIRNW